MTDHDLNAKLAELCGIPRCTREQVYGPSTIETTSPFIYRHDLFRPVVGGRTCEPWNPAQKWEQVHKYVIPAIERAGGNVFLMFHGKRGRSVAIDRDLPQAPGEDFETELLYDESGLTPRLVCLAALEAAKKLEADNGS